MPGAVLQPKPSWILLTEQEPLVYEKELLTEGKIHRKMPNGKIGVLTFTKEFLDNVLNNFLQMQENGVKVPVYLRHVLKEENRLGTVLDLTVRPNAKGKQALFMKVEWANEEAKKVGLANDVSIGLLEEYMDPKGAHYTWAMDHVACTARPNVPGLEGYVAVAASLDDSNPYGDINVEELIQLLGLEVSEDMTPEAKLQAIMGAVKELKTKASGDPNPQMTDPAVDPNAPTVPDPNASPAKPQKVTVQFSEDTVPGQFVKQGMRARRVELQNLLQDGKISANVHTQLVNKFCNEKSIRLSFVNDDTSFEDTVELLASNEAMSRSSSGEEWRLSQDDKDANLLMDAMEEYKQGAF